ncbi:Glycoside hydrolase, superfamily [Pseudocohnilembus persalinus]|uniref:Glycoside hydrolase, superfamily n=1 Tax=Pseudocohnilembus persalinus TaxID=266149 RepID=A0A0V0QPV2_PSEPJ|nr:Glycoside hydrolase, superfamily [Pseudocohnilembus persalinus]|eukprot:KRX04230.1 Glycoside hydrolase, superfamily [Pseudocohnilembus persalinus]
MILKFNKIRFVLEFLEKKQMRIYLEITTILPTNLIIGLGERNSKNLRLQKGEYTLYGRDDPSVLENNKLGNNVYSSHPVYLVKEKSGNYDIIFYKYSGAIDVINTEQTLTFKSVGGVFDFKIFFGDQNPETAVKLYHQYLGGGYSTPPFWSLGFHQSRWGYKNMQILINIADKYHSNKIPLDSNLTQFKIKFQVQILIKTLAMWSDLDFMIDKQTFRLHYVPLVDVAIGNKKHLNDPALIIGKQNDLFCYSPNSGKWFKGSVWPGNSYFPDFFHPKIQELWGPMTESLHQKTLFSGMWLDMNEPANFCNGECQYNDQNTVSQIPKSEYLSQPFDFPYNIGGGRNYKNLDHKTLPSNLIHYGGYYHKDVHNLYGHLDTYHTYMVMKNKLGIQLPFILTRSSFPGTGKYGQHWGGDNRSNWEFLRVSIPHIIQFNIYGIPMTGNDVCGFMGNTSLELCQRWIQAAILQPFFRNHNNDMASDQEFYKLGQGVMETARKNLKMRYSLLKYYYTRFIINNGTGTIMKPLFFEFPQDQETLNDKIMNEQYMIGEELMVTPILYQNIVKISPYFPGQWNELISGFKLKNGTNIVYNYSTDVAPLYIREGKLIPFQSDLALTTKKMNNKFDLIASLTKGDKYLQQYDFQYYSVGYLLNLQNYSNENEVVEKCLQNSSSCILEIIVGITSNYQVQIVLKNSNTSQDIVSNLKFNVLSIYNIPEELNVNSQYIDLYEYTIKISIEDWDIQNNKIYNVQTQD